MSNPENQGIPKGKKRKKKLHFGFVYLFLFIFLSALIGFSYLVKSFSPDIDVTIGNNEAMTLGESDMDVEVKSIDERLKWIQMEDDLPSVALRNFKEKNADELLDSDSKDKKDKKDKNEQENKSDKDLKDNKATKQAPVPTIEDIKKTDFREIPAAMPSKSASVSEKTATAPEKIVPAPKPSVTRVYFGSYSNIEDATAIQNEVSKIDGSLSPYIKSVNGSYIVQVGSFADKDRAVALVGKLKGKGLSPKISYEN